MGCPAKHRDTKPTASTAARTPAATLINRAVCCLAKYICIIRHLPHDFINNTPARYGLYNSTICCSISTPLALVSTVNGLAVEQLVCRCGHEARALDIENVHNFHDFL